MFKNNTGLTNYSKSTVFLFVCLFFTRNQKLRTRRHKITHDFHYEPLRYGLLLEFVLLRDNTLSVGTMTNDNKTLAWPYFDITFLCTIIIRKYCVIRKTQAFYLMAFFSLFGQNVSVVRKVLSEKVLGSAHAVRQSAD